MKTKLITALRTAAKALEDGTFAYDWNKMESCNCGIIACTLMHKSIKQVSREILAERVKTFDHSAIKSNFGPSWREAVQAHCPVTGLSESSILRTLQEAGMSPKDICELEDLSNPEAARRAGLETWGQMKEGEKQRLPVGQYDVSTPHPWWKKVLTGKSHKVEEKTMPIRTEKKYAIRYMRAWADILTEQGREDSVVEKAPTVSAAQSTHKE